MQRETKRIDRLVELRFDRDVKIYMDENLYSTLFRVTRENGNVALFFNRKYHHAADPKEPQWIDTTDLKEFNGVYYDSEKIAISGTAQHWLSPEHIIFLILRDYNNSNE